MAIHLVNDALYEVQGQRLHEQKLHAVHAQPRALADGSERYGALLGWQTAHAQAPALLNGARHRHIGGKPETVTDIVL